MKRIVMAVLLALSATACGGTTVDQFVQQFGGAYCAKIKACYPADYVAAYPAGDSACVATFTRGFSTEELEAETSCTTQQMDTCHSQINSLACGKSLSDSVVPTACSCQ